MAILFEFRRIEDREVDRALQVLQRVSQWLQQKGLRQRISQTSTGKYRQWQERGVNFGVFDEDQLMGIVSLPIEPLEAWSLPDQHDDVRWVRALATDPSHQGRGVGVFAMDQTLQRTPREEEIFLDCVVGFLPGYYQGLGFVERARQEMDCCSADGPMDVVLLSRRGTG